MRDASRIHIIRHGETEWNASGRKQGHSDSPLTPTGRAQAHALAARLTSESFTTLYSSDLGRAHSTARVIADRTGHEIVIDRRLRERSFGIFEGMTETKIHQRCREQYRSFISDDVGSSAARSNPEGESVREFAARATACLDEIAASHTGESVVVITHGGVMDALFRFVFNLPLHTPRQVKLWNAAINSFSYDDRMWTLHSWGDRNHLHEIKTLDDTSVTPG